MAAVPITRRLRVSIAPYNDENDIDTITQLLG